MIEHPQRQALNNEIHSRPRPPVAAPHKVSHIATLRPARDVSPTPPALAKLCADHGLAPPGPGQSHFFADFGRFRLKWERHGEFDDFTIYVPDLEDGGPFETTAFDMMPAGWTAGLEGELIAAVHVAVVRAAGADWGDVRRVQRALEAVDVLGAEIADAGGLAFSDLRLDPQGFTRFLLVNRAMTDQQAGREVQRLTELETYRMMAMLGFPAARRVGAELDRVEEQLTTLVARVETSPVEEEPAILREVTHLASIVERLAADEGFRFSATRAYHALVGQRGAELREQRLPGLQTITGFLERRFGPAMATCEAVSRRLAATAERVGRASALLRTRVDIEREKQNQDLLAAMNRRAKLQLRLQETVEGLSVAAITYYAVGLAAYVFKMAEAAGVPLDPDVATGLTVVPIALAVYLGIRAFRRSLARRAGER